jgi:hypothetical protein
VRGRKDTGAFVFRNIYISTERRNVAEGKSIDAEIIFRPLLCDNQIGVCRTQNTASLLTL